MAQYASKDTFTEKPQACIDCVRIFPDFLHLKQPEVLSNKIVGRIFIDINQYNNVGIMTS